MNKEMEAEFKKALDKHIDFYEQIMEDDLRDIYKAAIESEQVQGLIKTLELIQGQCGLPNSGDACRAILITAKQALEKFKEKK